MNSNRGSAKDEVPIYAMYVHITKELESIAGMVKNATFNSIHDFNANNYVTKI